MGSTWLDQPMLWSRQEQKESILEMFSVMFSAKSGSLQLARYPH